MEISTNTFLRNRIITSSLVLVLYFAFFTSIPLIVSISLGFATFHILEFINSLGKRINIQELIILMLTLNYLVFPYFTYFTLSNNVAYGAMAINPVDYYTYTLGSIIFLRIGLGGYNAKNWINYNFVGNGKKELIKNGQIGIPLIIIGVVGFHLREFVSSSLANIFYILGSVRFIGSIYLFYSTNKWRYLLISIVFIDFTITIIRGAMFYELLTWGIFFAIFLLKKHLPSFKTKLIGFITAIAIMFILQVVKTQYRKVAWSSENSMSTQVFGEILTSNLISDDSPELTSKSNFESFVARMNLGWVVSEIIDHVSTNQLYTNGNSLINDIPSIILPRFLYPNKKNVAGDDIRRTFTFYTGKKLTKQTTINLSAFGDAYINFGTYGGWLLIFLLGLFLRFITNKINFYAKSYPSIILWIPLIFFDVVRMNDFYFLLNSLLKNSILVFIFFYIFKNRLHLISDIQNYQNEIN